ncbi:uncharacterized protein V1510DRAFT_416697 [Dipodascopsis tothii]|uniref:uncharacterized protein n=1 Tax=Dipodascopsis tothii TaxID=44089 RepID=UPI0034CF688B
MVNNDVLIYGICVAVAVIPESLIAVLTITLAVATKAMAKGHVLVRKMQALEAIGGVTDICSDKTGTLTQGKMIVRRVWLAGAAAGRDSIAVHDSTNPFSPESGFLADAAGARQAPDALLAAEPALDRFLQAVALCNLAEVVARPAEKAAEWSAHGEPTEISLQVFAMRFGRGRAAREAAGWRLLAEHPFDSTVKKMSVVYEAPDGRRFAFVKGAVEAVLPCMDAASVGDAAALHARVGLLARDGLRVLCIGFRELGAKTDIHRRDDVEAALGLVGLAGLYDPPRLETRAAVQTAKRAGIRVHMLTGDHPGTAEAIAYEVGILGRDMPIETMPWAVMVARDFDAMSDDEIDGMLELPYVIARCAPSTKVRMVEALHRRRAFCVMTGDGVNDSPALKRADVGISMGLNGSDVAKDASEMILTDDDFASIVRAIQEGRRLFDNIQKFLMHLLISNISQVILLLVGLAFKDAQGVSVFPLSPLEILWANMITSSFLAMGLGMEEAQPDIMLRPPHDPTVGVFTWELIVDKMIYGVTMGVLCLASFVIVIYGSNGGQLGTECNHGFNDTCVPVFRARAVVFADLSFLLLLTAWEVKHFGRSLFNMFPDRESGWKGPLSVFPTLYSNRFLFWAVVGGFVGTFPVIYIPVVNKDVFKHLAISWEWGIVAGMCVAYLAVVEVWKAIKRRTGLWSGKALVPASGDLEAGAPASDASSASGSEYVLEQTTVPKPVALKDAGRVVTGVRHLHKQ